ncbi:uncharacterized protein STEHIDRAFT_125202 [Stereum hirsutum FP-91666 SS1]|uniref:uncharacterized protein n=1 Tax=Stereum hirsutum (strain FP-91666) TaxID=721885 RepID=UPI00044499ED|nr:uncharacterized protein STEHIDRAFT_125202 [Stereum hirsutum FP-91666 SS1]EIM81692.1 hypothetical protein STEHIDRAFT_125202 [Stereum hirsutum FP-91666 SS1]
MQLLLSTAVLLASTSLASAAYVEQYAEANCTGHVNQAFDLISNHTECRHQTGASLFMSTGSSFPCTFLLFNGTGCEGFISAENGNSENADHCLNFQKTRGGSVFIDCGVSS